MTTTEARTLLKAAYPGKHFYIQAMAWTKPDAPQPDGPFEFNVCVYHEQKPDGDWIASNGYASSLAEAVKMALADSPNKREGEAMFKADSPQNVLDSVRA